MGEETRNKCLFKALLPNLERTGHGTLGPCSQRRPGFDYTLFALGRGRSNTLCRCITPGGTRSFILIQEKVSAD